MKTICTVAAVITNEKSEVLLVRKKGSNTFIQPGGKPDAGEDALTALARELYEELGAEIVPESVVPLGTFEDRAVNEQGCLVRADTYFANITGTISPQAEIEELAWVPITGPFTLNVAPLSTSHILPAASNYISTNKTQKI